MFGFQPDGSFDGCGRKVLVVDSEESFAKLVEANLTRAKFEVTRAYSYEETLETIGQSVDCTVF